MEVLDIADDHILAVYTDSGIHLLKFLKIGDDDFLESIAKIEIEGASKGVLYKPDATSDIYIVYVNRELHVYDVSGTTPMELEATQDTRSMTLRSDLQICSNLLLTLDNDRVIGYSFNVQNASSYAFTRITMLDD